MKMIAIVALALMAAVVAAPVDDVIELSEYNNARSEDGEFQYGYKTNNGVQVNANGKLKDGVDEDSKPVKVLTIRGSYTTFREDGTPTVVEYYADETGYHAEGDSIPKVL